MKILITGGGGYIGSEMVETFLNKGIFVIVIDRFFFGDVLKDLQNRQNLIIIKDDTRIFDKKILKGIDVIIDLSSLSNDPSADLDLSTTESINTLAPIRTASLAKQMGVSKYIFSSSCSIYGANDKVSSETSIASPVSVYGRSKLNAEKKLLSLSSSKFSVTVLRNATVYGVSKRRMRFDLVINMMTLHAWKNKKIFIMGGGKQWRPLIHIKDVIKAFEYVAIEKEFKKINGEIFNVGSNNQNYQIYQIAMMIKKYFTDVIVETTPDDPDARNYRVDFRKINKILNYRTEYSIDDGIMEVKDALEKGVITEGITTNTGWYYKYLMEADKILSSVKLNNCLFNINEKKTKS